MEPLKNVYTESFIDFLGESVKKHIPSFDLLIFKKEIFNADWESKELKQRMRHIVLCIRPQLSENYAKMIREVLYVISSIRLKVKDNIGFEWMFFPEFVELYGMDDYEISVEALEEITQFTSCEFAVRPFILKYRKVMMKQMLKWSRHKQVDVRRLASEGCRPRLPWAMALPPLKVNPDPILPILENLKNDVSEYVRRSVANNLNDIAKDNPDLVIVIAKKWIKKTKETDKLVKHACRTLLKQGDPIVMELFGYGSTEKIMVNKFLIHISTIKIGDAVVFDFELVNENKADTLIRLEYGLYYQKANGTLSKKVFKISEKMYAANSSTFISRKQSFKIISTRKFHLGKHQIALIINGIEFEKYDFLLVD